MNAAPRPRVLVVSEDMALPIDEGIKKFAVSMVAGLSRHCDALAVSTSWSSETPEGVVAAPAGRLLLSAGLRRRVAAFAPDVICYVPSASCTLFSFLRARVLKRYAPRAKVALVALQGRAHGPLARRLIPRLLTDAVFAQSRETLERLQRLGCRPSFLPSGVDIERFRPVTADEKRALRRRHGLPEDAFLILHVGHVKPARNVSLLARAGQYGVPVLVAGSSAGADAALHRELESAGVSVITSYVPQVQELYQAADCYLFPVQDDSNAIDVPLSVLEAMACGLPVVSSRFGGLPLMFDEGDGLTFADGDEQALDALARLASERLPARTREKVEQYTWTEVAARFLAAIQQPGEVSEYAGAVAS